MRLLMNNYRYMKILIEINSDIIRFQWFLDKRVKVTSWCQSKNQINVRLFKMNILRVESSIIKF